MRISISNIAWDPSEDEAMVDLLRKHNINAIDIAPGKYFPNPASASAFDIQKVLQWWNSRGIALVGMQSLLFGTKGFNVFSPSRDTMIEYLSNICRVAGGLGSKRLVFGSPRNRDRSGLSDEETMDIACDFFTKLGDVAQKEGVSICLEPNPTFYGANFMTTCSETAHVVRSINHPAVGMQFDTGALSINQENPDSVLEDCSDIIFHIHASERNLVPLGDGETNHEAMGKAVQKFIPDRIVTIEMRATSEEPHLQSIERSLLLAKKHYGQHV